MPSESSDFPELIRQVRGGDQAAAERLVAEFEPLIRRELRVRLWESGLSHQLEAPDVCQSLWSSFFVRVAAGQFDIDEPRQLAKLLVVMARNKLASQARKQLTLKRDLRRNKSGEELLHEVADQAETPSSHVSAEEIQRQILSSLSEEERQLSELRRTGYSWAEVAARMGGTAQSRRMQLDRAADRVIAQLGLND